MEPHETGRYLMTTRKDVRVFKGKVVEIIERKGDAVYIWFTDGSAIEVGGARGYSSEPMVYHHKPKG